MSYQIIETESGLVVAGIPALATESIGAVIDPGPYESYDEALEALEALTSELDPGQGSSDVPAERALESRNSTN